MKPKVFGVSDRRDSNNDVPLGLSFSQSLILELNVYKTFFACRARFFTFHNIFGRLFLLFIFILLFLSFRHVSFTFLWLNFVQYLCAVEVYYVLLLLLLFTRHPACMLHFRNVFNNFLTLMINWIMSHWIENTLALNQNGRKND